MTSQSFCYWLQGFFELSDRSSDKANQDITLNSAQVRTIQNHLNMVFKHEIDPAMGDDKHQEDLNKIHSPFNSDKILRC